MALLAEEIVEEWLNRDGFFTIRGVKLGVHEMDLIAIRPSTDGSECRHIEVQASINPMSYLFPLPKRVRKATGKGPANSGHRPIEELREGAEEWMLKKFNHPRKLKLLSSLAPGPWSQELVVHNIRYIEELGILMEQKVKIIRLSDIVEELGKPGKVVPCASGGDLISLIHLGRLVEPSA